MNGQPAFAVRKLEKRAVRTRKGIQAVEWNVDREALAIARFPSPAHVTAT
jgi:hypothetical protein